MNDLCLLCLIYCIVSIKTWTKEKKWWRRIIINFMLTKMRFPNTVTVMIPSFNLVERLTNFLSLATDATFGWLHCLLNQRLSFIIHSTKDLQRCHLENWVFCIRYFLKTEAQINKNNDGMMFFMLHVKQVSLPKIILAQSCKNQPKKGYMPFLHKILQFFKGAST